jgi:hypothetical protein
MEENYINIFSVYLAKLIENRMLDKNSLMFIGKEFYDHCENIRSRQDLAEFLDNNLKDYPIFFELRQQLLNPNHKFN